MEVRILENEANICCYHCMTRIEDVGGIYCPECGKKHSVHYSKSDELPAGTYLNNGRYFVGRSIGSGGFGITYIGYDTKLERKILIKETFYNGAFQRNVNNLDDPEPLKVTYDNSFSLNDIMRKTKKECVSLSEAEGLNNVVKVYDWFSENNTAYIITEFINGVTMDIRIQQYGTYSWDELYTKLNPLMLSLSKLHNKGIIHRDIKPQNIMIKYIEDVGEEFILIDFGLARSTDTRTLPSVGLSFSPGYSPLEQRTFTIMDGEYTDIYSLSATIYFALTGKSPNSDILDTVEGNFPEINNLVTDYNVPQNVQDALIYGLNPNYKKRCSNLKKLMQMFRTEKPKHSNSKNSQPDTSTSHDVTPKNAANNSIINIVSEKTVISESELKNNNSSRKFESNNKKSVDEKTSIVDSKKKISQESIKQKDTDKPKNNAENNVSKPKTKAVSIPENTKKNIKSASKNDMNSRDIHNSSPAKPNKPVNNENSNRQLYKTAATNPDTDKDKKTENVTNHKIRNIVIAMSFLVAAVICGVFLNSTKSTSSSTSNTSSTTSTVATEGTCGDNAKWKFTKGELYITGNGAMTNYEWDTVPWSSKKTQINTVGIEDGITGIGNNAFYGCTNLSDIDIPDSVTSIGNYAFSQCKILKTIIIPKNVTSINQYVFSDCDSLYIITIPEKVNSINEFSFANCSKLKEITFTGDKPSLKSTSFTNVNALVRYPKNNKTWDDIKNKWDGGGSITFEAYGGENMTDKANSNEDRTDKAYSSKDKTDKTNSSKDMTDKTNDSNSSSNDSVSITAQGECGEHAEWALLEDTLYISGSGDMTDYQYEETAKLANAPWRYYLGNIKSIVIENGITSIGDNAFDSCINLTEVSLPDSITEISYGSFTNCSSLSTITIPETITSIKAYSFEACTSLSEITIPQNVTSIDESAFNGCYNLSTIIFKGNKPTMLNDTVNDLITFDQVTATVKYPINNLTWQNITQTWDGGGNMTFEAY